MIPHYCFGCCLCSDMYVQLPPPGYGAGVYEDVDDETELKASQGKAKLPQTMIDAANILMSFNKNAEMMRFIPKKDNECDEVDDYTDDDLSDDETDAMREDEADDNDVTTFGNEVPVHMNIEGQKESFARHETVD